METRTLEHVVLTHKNFSGKERKFTREGSRSFTILLSEELSKSLVDDGWKVSGKDDQYLVVWLASKPEPSIVMAQKPGEETPVQDFQKLDRISISDATVVIQGYEWELNGMTGRKTYLKSLYIH